MIKIRKLKLVESKAALALIPEGKQLINSINAYSFNNARKNKLFAEALTKGDFLIPDGISIVKSCHFFLHSRSKPKERVAGWDLFVYMMQRLNDDALNPIAFWKQQNANRSRPVVMFMGSSPKVLELITEKAARVYPNLEVVTYSPPFKQDFSDRDNQMIIEAINSADPDLLWIGMTAPKQEMWAYQHWNELDIHCNCGTIGAVFNFFAGTHSRAPEYWQNMGLEWLYRLLLEPRRMWRRYIIGNVQYVFLVSRERLGL